MRAMRLYSILVSLRLRFSLLPFSFALSAPGSARPSRPAPSWSSCTCRFAIAAAATSPASTRTLHRDRRRQAADARDVFGRRSPGIRRIPDRQQQQHAAQPRARRRGIGGVRAALASAGRDLRPDVQRGQCSVRGGRRRGGDETAPFASAMSSAITARGMTAIYDGIMSGLSRLERRQALRARC